MLKFLPFPTKGNAILALLLMPICAFAVDYKSGFGFDFQVSADWLVLTRPEIQRVYQNESQVSLELPTVDRATFEGYLQKVKTGQVEFAFDRRYSTRDWNNNISIQREPVRAGTPEQIAQATCPRLAAGLRGTWGTDVKVTSCGVRKIGEVPFVAYEYRIPAQDVSIVQFEIPFGFQGTLLLVGGSNDAGLASLRATQAMIAGSAIKSLRRDPAASGPTH